MAALSVSKTDQDCPKKAQARLKTAPEPLQAPKTASRNVMLMNFNDTSGVLSFNSQILNSGFHLQIPFSLIQKI